MTKVFKVDGVDLPDSAILMEGGNTNLPGGIGGLPTAAWYCEPGIGSISIDDPDGDYALAGWHTFTVDETECTGRERVWSGWLIGRRVNRGPYKDGPARVWSVDIVDINALFGFQVFRANSAQRPAETDVARMTWMLASAPMATTPAFDDGRFSTASPANLPAAEFVRSFPVDMAVNAAGQSGKNVYAYWDHDDDEIGFHYDFQANAPACDLRVSNVIADFDGVTTFYPFLDAELDADAYTTYTGVLLDYVGGAVYGENQDLIDELSPTEFSPSEFKRDQMLRSDRIGKLTTANAYLAKYLEEASQERENITLSIRLPASLVNYVEAGMLIDVKFTHLPGLDDFTTLPIIRCSKLPTANRTDTWDVRIQLSTNVKAALSLGGDPGVLPYGKCEPELVQSVQKSDVTMGDPVVLDQAPTPGNFLILWSVIRGTPSDEFNPDGFTGLGADWVDDPSTSPKDLRCRIWYRQVEAGDTATINGTLVNSPGSVYMCVAEFAGISQFDFYDEYLDDTDQGAGMRAWGAGPITPTAGRPTVVVGGMMPSLNTSDYYTPAETTGANQLGLSGFDDTISSSSDPKSWFGYKAGPESAGTGIIFTTSDVSPAGISRGHAGLSAVFSADPCDDPDSGIVPPPVGTWITENLAAPDGTQTTFSTRWTFDADSLQVWVDNTEQTSSITSTDPTAKTFTLSFAPTTTERVRIRYKVAPA